VLADVGHKCCHFISNISSIVVLEGRLRTANEGTCGIFNILRSGCAGGLSNGWHFAVAGGGDDGRRRCGKSGGVNLVSNFSMMAIEVSNFDMGSNYWGVYMAVWQTLRLSRGWMWRNGA
jgi:hypothetical protein